MIEYIDVLNEKGEKTGSQLPKSEVHSKSLWHLSVNLWVVTPDNKILLQKRSKNKDAFPGCWAHAASGHVSAGETSIEATIKEAEEEIGLSFKPSDLEYLFSYSKVNTFDGRKITHRSHFDVYMTCIPISSDKIEMQPEEVEEVKLVDLEELEQMTKAPGLMISFPEEYPKMLEVLKKRFYGSN